MNVINTAESGPELAQSGEHELNSVDSTISPMKGVIMSRADPPSLALAARETSNKTASHETRCGDSPPRAVTGRSDPVWAAESVITPVIVSGLAANRTNGVKDALEFDGAFCDFGGVT